MGNSKVFNGSLHVLVVLHYEMTVLIGNSKVFNGNLHVLVVLHYEMMVLMGNSKVFNGSLHVFSGFIIWNDDFNGQF